MKQKELQSKEEVKREMRQLSNKSVVLKLQAGPWLGMVSGLWALTAKLLITHGRFHAATRLVACLLPTEIPTQPCQPSATAEPLDVFATRTRDRTNALQLATGGCSLKLAFPMPDTNMACQSHPITCPDARETSAIDSGGPLPGQGEFTRWDGFAMGRTLRLMLS